MERLVRMTFKRKKKGAKAFPSSRSQKKGKRKGKGERKVPFSSQKTHNASWALHVAANPRKKEKGEADARGGGAVPFFDDFVFFGPSHGVPKKRGGGEKKKIEEPLRRIFLNAR